jgi:hypothetical protein
MIGRPVKGTGFRGVLNYLADKENVRILGGDMAGRNARELAHEFGLLRRQRPGLKRAVAHMFLRPAPGEYLSDEQWKTIARYYLSGMGFSDSPHVLFLDVEPHPHLHLVASRITYSGTVVSDSNDYQRSSDLLRNIERQYGLRVVSAHPELASPKPGDYGRSRRTGIPPFKTRLQAIVSGATTPLTLSAYLDHLHRHGVSLLPNIARTGRVSGISYVYEGQVMKGSDLGRDHTWAALLRRILPSPDDPALLEAERARAQEALGTPPTESPLAPQDLPGRLASPSTATSATGTLSDTARAILDRAAASESALRGSIPETYASHALAYSLSANRAERLLRDSLDVFRPRDGSLRAREGDALEAFARSLVPESAVPPTRDRLEQLLGEEREARQLLSVPSAVSPENAEQSFNAAIDRSIAARQQIQLFDLEVEVHLVDVNLRYAAAPQDSPRTEFDREFEHLYDLRHRVDLARADRELDLRFSTRGIETPDYRVEQELRAGIADLHRYFEEAAPPEAPAFPPLSIPGARPLELSEVPVGELESRASHLLDQIRESERVLSLSSVESFPERLAGYLEITGSVRTLVLDSFNPDSGLPLSDRETGKEVARQLLRDHRPEAATLTLDHVGRLEEPSRRAFHSFLKHPGPTPQTSVDLKTVLDRNFELHLTAFQAAAAAERLPRRGGTDEQNLEALHLQLIANRVELHATLQEVALSTLLAQKDPLYKDTLDRANRRADELLDKTGYLEYLLTPDRVENLGAPPLVVEAKAQKPQTDRLITLELFGQDAGRIAEAFRFEARFSPDPPFFLAPTREELPGLAASAHTSFEQLASADRALRSSTPETYPSLALSHAANAAAAERVDQQLAVFNPTPIPRDLPGDRLGSYLETRLQLYEALAAPPSKDRDSLVAALNERIEDLHPASPISSRTDLPRLLEDHREAYRELNALLGATSPEPEAFRAAVARALDRHAELEQLGARLEGQLQAIGREHAILSGRQGSEGAEAEPRLGALERQIRSVEPRYFQARIEIADRDLELLGRHLQARPSSETLDRYTELLQDRGDLIARLRENRAEGRPPKDPAIDLGAARQAVLQNPSEESLHLYRLAVLEATQAAERGSFAREVANVSLRRAELRSALSEAERPQGRALVLPDRQAELRQAANRYVDARENLAEHAQRPPRRGTTVDYAAHAQATDLSPAALDRLRRRAYLDYKRNPSPNPLAPVAKPRAREARLSRDQALPLAVKRLQKTEAALNAQLQGIKRLKKLSPGHPLTPETNRRLVSSIDAYQNALAQVERLSRSQIPLSPFQFLKHPSFNRRPLQALAAWTGYATRKGLPPSQIGRALRSFGFPFVAGIAARAAQSAVSRFFQDQVHER